MDKHAGSSKGATDKASQVCLLRIKRDITDFHADPPPGIFIAPVETDVRNINAILTGAPGTPHKGGFFHLYLESRPVPAATPEAQSLSSLLVSIQSLLSEACKFTDKDAGDRFESIIQHETIRVAVCDTVDACVKENSPFAQTLKGRRSRDIPGALRQVRRRGVYQFETLLTRLRDLKAKMTKKKEATADANTCVSTSTGLLLLDTCCHCIVCTRTSWSAKIFAWTWTGACKTSRRMPRMDSGEICGPMEAMFTTAGGAAIAAASPHLHFGIIDESNDDVKPGNSSIRIDLALLSKPTDVRVVTQDRCAADNKEGSYDGADGDYPGEELHDEQNDHSKEVGEEEARPLGFKRCLKSPEVNGQSLDKFYCDIGEKIYKADNLGYGKHDMDPCIAFPKKFQRNFASNRRYNRVRWSFKVAIENLVCEHGYASNNEPWFGRLIPLIVSVMGYVGLPYYRSLGTIACTSNMESRRYNTIIEKLRLGDEEREDDCGPVVFIKDYLRYEDKVWAIFDDLFGGREHSLVMMKFLALAMRRDDNGRHILFLHGEAADGKAFFIKKFGR
ncbi:hypothetical protein HPB50_017102 [Hyalomma asiaticum]|uniref:Uncharacterized protein n=1 Tax=Hyalomma asiaticum TaxID=266040 RepID=A0ACB7T343_HYAAI|nr:hypothetical protein HPB50_017102 [Hyalomma asiaticum]